MRGRNRPRISRFASGDQPDLFHEGKVGVERRLCLGRFRRGFLPDLLRDGTECVTLFLRPVDDFDVRVGNVAFHQFLVFRIERFQNVGIGRVEPLLETGLRFGAQTSQVDLLTVNWCTAIE